MRPNIKITLLLFMLLLVVNSYGQRAEVRRAQDYLENEEYYMALEYFNKAGEKGAEFNTDIKLKMAQCYYHLKNISEAFQIYLEFENELEGEDVVNYASCWHQEGGFEIAIDWYEKAKKEGANPLDMNDMINACEWAMENGEFNTDVVVNPASLLIGGQSFGIQYYEDGVVYSAAKKDKSKDLDRSGKQFQNLFFSKIVDGELQESSISFSSNLVSHYHVGATAFTSDFKRIYYTKVVRIKGGDSRIKIFTSEFDGSEWVNEKKLSINSDDYNVAYPAVSPDNKYLYFTSTQRGGFGGKDLYRGKIQNNGDVMVSENLGMKINTFGNEEWPFISSNGTLYFASDGHLGFGGLDIFKAELTDDGYDNITNLRQPINSGKDDFGYVLDPAYESRGFLSSNRIGTGYTDAIFRISPQSDLKDEEVKDTPPIVGLDEVPVFDDEQEIEVEEPVQEPVVKPETVVPVVDLSMYPEALITKITSTYNGGVIEGVNIELKDAEKDVVVASGITGTDGKVNIIIPDEYKKDSQEFELIISKGEEYTTKRMIINIMEIEDINSNGLMLTPIFNDVVLDEISTMVIPYVGEQITNEGLNTLDRLAAFLIQNPNIVVKLNGHTESRGTRYNNLNVSQKMAEKAEEILISKGVNDELAIPRGYGERYLKNRCKRGIYCADSQHLENRRIEVVVWRTLN